MCQASCIISGVVRSGYANYDVSVVIIVDSIIFVQKSERCERVKRLPCKYL